MRGAGTHLSEEVTADTLVIEQYVNDKDSYCTGIDYLKYLLYAPMSVRPPSLVPSIPSAYHHSCNSST